MVNHVDWLAWQSPRGPNGLFAMSWWTVHQDTSEYATSKCCVVRSPTHLAPCQLVESHKPPTLACPSYHCPLSFTSMRARARKWMERNRAVSCVKKDIIRPKIFDPISSLSFGSPQSISCVHPHICKAYVFFHEGEISLSNSYPHPIQYQRSPSWCEEVKETSLSLVISKSRPQWISPSSHISQSYSKIQT